MSSNWYGEDGTNGTVAVTNGSPTVTGTSTQWLTNNAATAGDGFRGPDGKSYGILSVTADGTLTLNKNYEGSTASAQPYAIIPLQAGRSVALSKLLATLLNSSNYTQISALAPSVGDFIQFVAGSPNLWTNRSVAQVLLSLFNGAVEANVASATNTDIGAQTTPKLSITGTTAIASLNPASGTMTPNAIRFLRFAGILTLTNGANLILPGGANITTAAGDTAIFTSDATATPIWRCIAYQRAHGGAPIFTGVTGSGNNVGSNSPTLVTPALGTPSSVVLTNATGCPISTGVSGLGTGVATLLSGTASGTGGPAGTASPTFTGTLAGAAGTFTSLGMGSSPANGGFLGTASAAILNSAGGGAGLSVQVSAASALAIVARVDDATSLFADFRFNGTTRIGSIAPTGGGTGTAFSTSSARALKMAAEPLDASAVIARSRMYRGKWIQRPDQDWVGGIADEMGLLVPEGYRASRTPELAPHQDGYEPDQFDYSKYVPYLVAEAQRAQESEKAALAKLASIEARLAAAGI